MPSVALVLAVYALTGCGGAQTASNAATTSTSTGAPLTTASTTATPTTPGQLHATPTRLLSTTIDVHSPAVSASGKIAARYTCDGANASLPVNWSNIPPHTAELALFLLSGAEQGGELHITGVDWGVTGLKPTLHGLASGRLPAGTVLGRNDFGGQGYSLCPRTQSPEEYEVVLYALPRKLGAKPGFSARAERREAAAAASAGGKLSLTYQRARFEVATPFNASSIPVRYTCDGADSSPPLTWHNVPSGTAELLVLILTNLKDAHGHYRFAWVVAGIDPALGSVRAGSLPPGAVVGRNESGRDAYTVCPSKGHTQEYLLAVLALNHRLGLKQGFDPTGLIGRLSKGSLGSALARGVYKRP